MITTTPCTYEIAKNSRFGIGGHLEFVKNFHNRNFVCYRKNRFQKDPRLNFKYKLQNLEMSGVLFLIKRTVNCPCMRFLVHGEKPGKAIFN